MAFNNHIYPKAVSISQGNNINGALTKPKYSSMTSWHHGINQADSPCLSSNSCQSIKYVHMDVHVHNYMHVHGIHAIINHNHAI